MFQSVLVASKVWTKLTRRLFLTMDLSALNLTFGRELMKGLSVQKSHLKASFVSDSRTGDVENHPTSV